MGKQRNSKTAEAHSNTPAKVTRRTLAVKEEEDETLIEAQNEEVSLLENDDDDGDEDSDSVESNGKSEKRGKRPIIFACSGYVTLPEDVPARNLFAGDKACVQESMAITMPESKNSNVIPDIEKGRKEVIARFEAKYGQKPECISVPFYAQKGTAVHVKKRETLNVTIAEGRPFIGKRGVAIHRLKDFEWNVLVNFTTDPSIVWIFYQGLVDPESAPKGSEKKVQKPGPKFIHLNVLKNLKESAPNA